LVPFYSHTQATKLAFIKKKLDVVTSLWKAHHWLSFVSGQDDTKDDLVLQFILEPSASGCKAFA
jgi:hypothetical protein